MKAIFVVATLAVTIPAWARPRPVSVPAVLFNAGQCHAHLAGPRRAQCVECIRTGGKFHTQGIRGPGFCRGHAPPPPPPPPAEVLDHPRQCKGIPRAGKRQRCHECTRNGGRFHTQGPRHGHCQMPPPPPADVLDRPRQCKLLARPHKRQRCHECIRNGGRFHTQGVGHGHCQMPPPPPPPADVLDHPGQCKVLARPPKRQRCHECIRNGGRFHTQGVGHGFCQGQPPPPPPPPEIALNVPECNTRAFPMPKRVRCRACVRHGGRFFLRGPGRCEGAPPPPPPGPRVATNVPDCNTHAFPIPKRVRCRECVRHGGTFVLAGPGHCRGAPRPRPGLIHSVPECNRRLGPNHLRRQCRRCVKRGGRFHMNGTCHM